MDDDWQTVDEDDKSKDVNEKWLSALFPGKPAKCKAWLDILQSQECDTFDTLRRLGHEEWKQLGLPLAVKSEIRHHIQNLHARAIKSVLPPATRPITQVDVIVVDVSMSMRALSDLDPHEATIDSDGIPIQKSAGGPSNRCTREDISKKIFHTLIDKTLVFELAHAVGLVSFGEVVNPVAITTEYEDFHDELGRLDANQGSTRLYDAISEAASIVTEFCSDNVSKLAVPYDKLDKRIFVLTDGQDNSSQLQPWEVAQQLQTSGIVLDAIPLAGANTTLAALCTASGGLCFDCVDQEQSIALFESEATLKLGTREVDDCPAIVTISSPSDFSKLSEDVCVKQPKTTIRAAVPKSVYAPVLSGKQIKDLAANSARAENRGLQRVLKEYGQLSSNPPDGWRVFVSADNPLTWKAIFERGVPNPEWLQQVGPCPYTGGRWVVSIDFPMDYPFQPPRIRFVTPIYHCNISTDGKICMEILQNDWSPALSMSKVLDGIRLLLFSPDAQNPLDAFKGALYRDNLAKYMSEATKHTQSVALESFSTLAKRYNLESANE